MRIDGENGLDRFVKPQEGDYARALSEIRGGRKQSHWMWHIFPQLDGLGTSWRFKRKEREEREGWKRESGRGRSPSPWPSPEEGRGESGGEEGERKEVIHSRSVQMGSVFERVLGKFYGGERDEATLRMLRGE